MTKDELTELGLTAELADKVLERFKTETLVLCLRRSWRCQNRLKMP